jgi:hypothetical protein
MKTGLDVMILIHLNCLNYLLAMAIAKQVAVTLFDGPLEQHI